MNNLKPIPKFRPHGIECKGCQNYMLDCTFESQDDRDVMINVLDKHIQCIEKELT